eukprot:359663-Chlamydomonas_euryale.AAC.1
MHMLHVWGFSKSEYPESMAGGRAAAFTPHKHARATGTVHSTVPHPTPLGPTRPTPAPCTNRTPALRTAGLTHRRGGQPAGHV